MLLWIKEIYGTEFVCFCTNVEQDEECDGLKARALETGERVKQIEYQEKPVAKLIRRGCNRHTAHTYQ